MMNRNLSKLLLAGACALALSAPASAGKFTRLHVFRDNGKDGVNPTTALAPDGEGNFYGITGSGGRKGLGTVFRIAADGTEAVVYFFRGGSDGAHPSAGVTFGPDGALYGTTSSGGGDGCNHVGCGTVYRLTIDGQESVLHAFVDGADGANPRGRVVFDGKGNLYGTTANGGDPNGDNDYGTVFKISAKGSESILYAFKGGSNAFLPAGTMVFDNAGNLFGTAAGGASKQGSIFKLTPDGVESLFYSFHGNGSDDTDGRGPTGDLLIDAAGNLFGTTGLGGDVDFGTVFRVTPDGVETLLHSFDMSFDGSGGAFPHAGLVADAEGNLYGTTSEEGTDNFGTVFKLEVDGTFTDLHLFKKIGSGIYPHGGVTLDGLGNLYGTTWQGGGSSDACGFAGCGTVFKLKVR